MLACPAQVSLDMANHTVSRGTRLASQEGPRARTTKPIIQSSGAHPMLMGLELSEDCCPVPQSLRAGFREVYEEDLSHVRALHMQGCAPACPPTQLLAAVHHSPLFS